jgi:hypothetical protein
MNTAVQESGRYVYCIIKSPGGRKSFGKMGFGDQEVYTLDYRNLAPVVSDIAMKKFDVNDGEILYHDRVVREVMKDHTVIPVAYGMAFKNKKLLLVAMSAGYTAMTKALKVIDNKVELGIKVIIPQVTISKDELERVRSDYLSRFKNKAAQWKELKLFSERLLLNASFLVEQKGIDEFSEEVKGLERDMPLLKVIYSGPWPPYNFVDIHILSKRRGGFR